MFIYIRRERQSKQAGLAGSWFYPILKCKYMASRQLNLWRSPNLSSFNFENLSISPICSFLCSESPNFPKHENIHIACQLGFIQFSTELFLFIWICRRSSYIYFVTSFCHFLVLCLFSILLIYLYFQWYNIGILRWHLPVY